MFAFLHLGHFEMDPWSLRQRRTDRRWPTLRGWKDGRERSTLLQIATIAEFGFPASIPVDTMRCFFFRSWTLADGSIIPPPAASSAYLSCVQCHFLNDFFEKLRLLSGGWINAHPISSLFPHLPSVTVNAFVGTETVFSQMSLFKLSFKASIVTIFQSK